MRWSYLWAHARYDLHLGEREFWSMSPRQFAALDARYKYRRECEDYLTGLVASVIANYSFGGAKTPLEPVDFPLPTLRRKARPLPTDEELAAQINADLAAHAAMQR